MGAKKTRVVDFIKPWYALKFKDGTTMLRYEYDDCKFWHDKKVQEVDQMLVKKSEKINGKIILFLE